MYIKNFINYPKIIFNKYTRLIEAAGILSSSGLSYIPVINEKGKAEGVFSLNGLAKAFIDKTSPNDTIEPYIEEAVVINVKTKLIDLLNFSLEKVIIVDDNEKFIGVISFKKLIRNLLKQRDDASTNLNAILDTSTNCIVSIDKKGNITYLNKSAAKFLNVNVEEALGNHVEKFIPNSRLPEIVRNGKAEIGQHFTFGEKTFITNRTPILQNDDVVGALAIFQDITELQSTMEELTNVKQYKDILETIIDNDYDCIVVVDANGIITMFNKAYENFIGVPREKAIGRHVTEVIENTRMHIVARTGKAEIADIQKICGNEMICNRIPIRKNGKIWGAFGKTMFKDVKELTALVEKVNRLQNELEYYKDVVKKIQGASYTFDNIIGSTPEMKELKSMAQRVAMSNSTVLIRGESGTGKELFAHAIHYVSPRKYGPFIKVNCSAIPENLLESELFGYEEGAFTGAKRGGKIGKFEMADKGTIFLDEIGDMPINMQVKLLRVLQEKEIERVGGTKSIPVDVRIIAATNRPLEKLIKEEKFRMDLYYRLNVVELKIPPLRLRKQDIPQLINHLLNKLALKMGCPVPKIDPKALEVLQEYHWPGNIRELENVLERCLNFIDNSVIKTSNLPYHIRNYEANNNKKMLLKDLLDETERSAIINALEMCKGNKIKAAKMLGISRANIYQKIEKYGLK